VEGEGRRQPKYRDKVTFGQALSCGEMRLGETSAAAPATPTYFNTGTHQPCLSFEVNKIVPHAFVCLSTTLRAHSLYFTLEAPVSTAILWSLWLHSWKLLPNCYRPRLTHGNTSKVNRDFVVFCGDKLTDHLQLQLRLP
jgi:hypothetical protein